MIAPNDSRPAFLRTTVQITALLGTLALSSCDPTGGGNSEVTITENDQDPWVLELLQDFFAPDPEHRAGQRHKTDEQLQFLFERQAQKRRVTVVDIQSNVKAWTERVKKQEDGDPYHQALAALADAQVTVAANHSAKAYTAAMRTKTQARKTVRMIAQLWAESLMDQDHFGDATNAYNRVIALTDETQETPVWVQAQEARAYALWKNRRFDDMVPSMRLAVSARKTQKDLQGEPLCYSLVFLGKGLREQKNLTEAQTVLQEAVDLMPKLAAFSPALKYETLCSLGEILSDQERLDEALLLLQEAQTLRESANAPTVSDPLQACFLIGEIIFRQGRLEEALPWVRQSSEGYEKAGKGWEQRLMTSLHHESLILAKLGRAEETIPITERLLTQMEKNKEGLEFSLSDVCNNLGHAYIQAQRFPDAEKQLQRAVGLVEQKLGPDHADVAVPLANLAAVIARQGRLAEAEPLIWDAVTIDMRASVVTGKLAPNLVIHTRMFAGMMDAQGVASEVKTQRVMDIAREVQLPDALWQEFARLMTKP